MKKLAFSISTAAGTLMLAAGAFASDVGVYPAVPPPTSLYPFNQPSTAATADDARRAPAPAGNAGARDVPAPGGRDDAPVDRVTGVVTAPGYMGPRAVKGQ